MKARILFPLIAASIIACQVNAAATPGQLNNLESITNPTNAVSTLDKILKDNPIVVLDFYASWCGPCQRMLPTISTLASEYRNVIFIKVNTGIFSALSNKYSIRSIPALIFFKNGSIAQRTTGLKSKSELTGILNNLSR